MTAADFRWNCGLSVIGRQVILYRPQLKETAREICSYSRRSCLVLQLA
jgi:hypothetical protein